MTMFSLSNVDPTQRIGSDTARAQVALAFPPAKATFWLRVDIAAAHGRKTMPYTIMMGSN